MTQTDNAHRALLARVRAAAPADPVPGEEALAAHLAARLALVGRPALMEFQHLARVAAARWGAEATAHFGRVLRRGRAGAKPPRRTKRDEAIGAIGALPSPWRDALLARLGAEAGAGAGAGANARIGARTAAALPRRGRGPLLGPDHALSVARALARWAAYAAERGLPLVPTGTALDAYGRWLLAGGGPGEAGRARGAPSLRSVADYLARIEAGLAAAAPEAGSAARAWVVRDWRERARGAGPTTKTGAQLVGASAIYALGFDLIRQAQQASPRGMTAARLYRNGLLLALGAALPERARALAALAFGTTLMLPGEGRVHVHLPPAVLKMPEAQRAGAAPYEAAFTNPALAEALEEYRTAFRPLFDDGACLFPSVKAPGRALGERQIGRLAGNLTERAFGVRVPVHRIRDNVATEAAETLAGGGLAAAALLRHRDAATTARHYDHSDGLNAARAFGAEIDRRRSRPADLLL